MKKKIIFVTSTINFYETFFFDTINNLSIDNEIYIVSNLKNKRKINPNIKLINLNISRSYNVISDIKSIYNLFKIIKKTKPYLILSSTPKGGLLCSLVNLFFKIKRVHFLTGILWSNTRSFKKYFFLFLDRIILFNTYCVFVDSQSQIDLMIENKYKHNFKLIGYGSIKGVDTDIFKKDLSIKLKFNKEYNFDRRFLILFVGRISYEKGIYDFINIINQLNNLYHNKYLGIIVGNDEKNILKKISNSKNFIKNNFLIKDFTLNPEVYMQVCDVILIPSSREGFCQVAIEASSCEVPIIAYDVLGLKDSIINEITGYLVNYGDLNKIINLISKLKDNPDLRDNLGYQGRMMVIKKFKKKFVLSALLDSLKKIISS